jgi:hypothetical protein
MVNRCSKPRFFVQQNVQIRFLVNKPSIDISIAKRLGGKAKAGIVGFYPTKPKRGQSGLRRCIGSQYLLKDSIMVSVVSMVSRISRGIKV